MCAVSYPLGHDSDLKKVIGIQVNKTDVPILSQNFQFMRGRTVDILRSKVFDSAALGLPIRQRAIDLGIFHQCFHIISGHALRIFTAEKWRNLPSVLAVIRLDLCHPLERSFGAHFIGALFCLQITKLDLALYRNQQLTA